MTLIRRLLAAVAFICLVFPAPARAQSRAEAVVRTFYAELLGTMEQGPVLGFNGRYAKLAPAVKAAFDMPLMTRSAVGVSWAKASDKERSDLIDAFTRFSVSSYANRFATRDGEDFFVTGEKTSPAGIVVETILQPKTGETVALNYLLRADAKGSFRIVDVLTNGTISELAMRRSEFSSIARHDGLQALIEALNKKATQLVTP